LRKIEPKVVRAGGKVRLGRGFSLKELAEAGICRGEALKLGIPVDVRRRSFHEENVKVLRRFLAEAEKSGRRRKRVKKRVEEAG